jgi:hypothetical protein
MSERIRLLDDLGAEFARVAAEAERPSRAGLRARTLAIALGVALVLAGGAYSVPATRAAVDGIADSFAAWVTGDSDEAPGRPLEPGDVVPAWFSDIEGGEARVIAEAEGLRLFVRRSESDEGPRLEFWLGEALGMGDTLDGWRRRLGRHAVVVLGHTPVARRDVLDEQGRVPLFGVTNRDVERVEVRYSEGPPLAGNAGDGGFVLLVDAWRRPLEVIAYDAAGHVLGRADASEPDLRYLCEKEPGVCPSGARRLLE